MAIVEVGLHEAVGPYEYTEPGYEGVDSNLSPEQTALIEGYMNLAYSRAAKYYGKNMEAEDVAQNALLGLVLAAQRFDLSQEVHFSTYAQLTIDGTIIKGFRTSRLVNYRKLSDNHHVIGRVRGELLDELQREPTEAEIIARTELAPETVRSFFELNKTHSLDNPLEDGMPIGSLLPDAKAINPEEQVIHDEAADRVRQLLEIGILEEPEAEVIRHRFLYESDEQPSQKEVGRFIGRSQVTVSRLEQRALQKLRSYLDTQS
jgi:RNA polymerase sigma factor (sigma-70 family)